MTTENPATTVDDLRALADRVIELVRPTPAGDDEVEANVLVGRTRPALTRFANSFIHQHVGEDRRRRVGLTVAVGGRTATAGDHRHRVDDGARRAHRRARSSRPRCSRSTRTGRARPRRAEVAGADNFDAGHRDAPARRAGGAGQGVRRRRRPTCGPPATSTPQAHLGRVRLDRRAAGRRAAAPGPPSTASTRPRLGRVGPPDLAAAGRPRRRRGRRRGRRPRPSARPTFVDLEPGEYEVVLGPEAVATMLIFLAVYGFNAKMHLEGASFVKLGEQQLDGRLTIVGRPDRPARDRAALRHRGHAATPLPSWSTRACPRSLAHDRRTARRAGAETTGSAIPGGSEIGAVPTTSSCCPATTSAGRPRRRCRTGPARDPVQLLPDARPEVARSSPA